MKTNNVRWKYFRRLKKSHEILVLALVVSLSLCAQEGVYKNLNEALQNKDQVKELRLHGKKLTTIPLELIEFENLEVLSLKRNRLDSLPDWFSDLPIQDLNLAKNQFKRIPGELFELTFLEYLDLSENEIEDLESGEFKKMKTLKVLELWGNLIEDIPMHMTEIPELVKLDLRLMEFNRFKQKEILEMFPNTKVYMSPPCNCK